MPRCRVCGVRIKKRNNIKYCSRECYRKSKYTGRKIKCDFCGKEFYRQKSEIRTTHNFCSEECYHNWDSKQGSVAVACEVCGKEFKKNRFFYNRDKRHFCSRKCRAKGYSKENNPRWNSVLIECDFCGREFQVHSYELKQLEHHFCSRNCYKKWRKGKFKGEESSRWKGGKIERICRICGKKFSVKPCVVKNGLGKTCSRKCQHKWVSILNTGRKHSIETVRKIIKSLNQKPNKTEVYLNSLIQTKVPNTWEFNVETSRYIIDGKVPDWVHLNGEKKVIELFGEPFHEDGSPFGISYRRTEKGTIERYNSSGYECLIIWTKELYKNEEKVLESIVRFSR